MRRSFWRLAYSRRFWRLVSLAKWVSLLAVFAALILLDSPGWVYWLVLPTAVCGWFLVGTVLKVWYVENVLDLGASVEADVATGPDREEQLRNLAVELGVKLPQSYRHAMLHCPLKADHDELQHDVRRVLELNQYLRENGFFGQSWRPTLLAVGEDGAGNVYAVDLAVENSPMLQFDHDDTVSLERLASVHVGENLKDWIDAVRSEEADVLQARAARLRRRQRRLT